MLDLSDPQAATASPTRPLISPWASSCTTQAPTRMPPGFSKRRCTPGATSCAQLPDPRRHHVPLRSAHAATGPGRHRRGDVGAAWAGGSHLAVYGASKAFDLVLAESLWAELSPAGVDVLGMVLGPTDTPAFRKVLNGRQLDGLADPDDVARDMLDNVANGPTFPARPHPVQRHPASASGRAHRAAAQRDQPRLTPGPAEGDSSTTVVEGRGLQP